MQLLPQMRPRTQHLIETRFSVRFSRDQDAFSREWLDERVDLWRRFCLPSIAAQTADGFTWLVLCDASTDPEVLAALRSHEREVPALEVAITGGDRTPRDVVRSRIDSDVDVLITSWLDSDDAVADRFVESIQAYVEPFALSEHESLVLNFPRGYRLDVQTETLYEDRVPHSSFPSLFERPQRGPVETVLSSGELMLRHRHPTHQDESLHAWLITVHGGNLVNWIGRFHHPATKLTGTFPGIGAGSG